MAEMGLSFSGREHSGLDDAANTARLALRIAADGHLLRLTRDVEKGIDVKGDGAHLLRPSRCNLNKKISNSTENGGNCSSNDGGSDGQIANSKDDVEKDVCGASLKETELIFTENENVNRIKCQLAENDSGIENESKDVISVQEDRSVSRLEDSGMDGDVIVILDELPETSSKSRNQPLSERSCNVAWSDVAVEKATSHLGLPLRTSTPYKTSLNLSPTNSNSGPFVKASLLKKSVEITKYLGTAPLCHCGVRCKLSWVNQPGPNQV